MDGCDIMASSRGIPSYDTFHSSNLCGACLWSTRTVCWQAIGRQAVQLRVYCIRNTALHAIRSTPAQYGVRSNDMRCFDGKRELHPITCQEGTEGE